MATILLIVIYAAFMSLGVPHSLIGAAWPDVCNEFGLGQWQLGIITFIISGCTVIASILSAKIVKILGTAKTAAFCVLLTAVTMLLYVFSGNFIVMCLLAIPLGLGAGAIDAGLNNYIATHYKSYHMNFLHCFYGVGASVSPWFISLALKNGGWRGGYLYAFIFQGIIALLLFLSFPLWKKVKKISEEEEEDTIVLSLKEQCKSKKIRSAWGFMMATNIIEYACGTWLCTYFVTHRGFENAEGAILITLFYAGMAVGRFLSGAISKLIGTWKRIYICAALTFLSILVVMLPVPKVLISVFIFLIGVGNGPIYPNFIYLIPYNFDKGSSQSIMGSVIASAYTGVMITPVLFGMVTKFFGLNMFLYFLMAIFVIMVLFSFVFVKQLGNNVPEN